MNSNTYSEVMNLLDRAMDLINDLHADGESQEQYDQIEEMYRAILDAYDTVDYYASQWTDPETPYFFYIIEFFKVIA